MERHAGDALGSGDLVEATTGALDLVGAEHAGEDRDTRAPEVLEDLIDIRGLRWQDRLGGGHVPTVLSV